MSYTARLFKARRAGVLIVCSLAPYEGRPVQYRPRHRHDAQPWVPGWFPLQRAGMPRGQQRVITTHCLTHLAPVNPTR